mmetsp:Transcript_93590/g.267793  ORF Transcript_93590/g.267793 Transcript_93590/m.267793 type:complete len:295 (+) Transcript_93590:1915-2799(+)
MGYSPSPFFRATSPFDSVFRTVALRALSFFLLRPWCNCLNSALDGSHTTNDWESGDSMEGDEYGEEYIELTADQEDDERKGREWDESLTLSDATSGSHDTGELWNSHEHGPGSGLYASWRNGSAQLVVFDEDLRVVLWSKGLARACGFHPAAGLPLKSFPFVSDEKRLMMEESLRRLDRKRAPMLPVYALNAAVLAEPNTVIHLSTSRGVGGSYEVALMMKCIKICPLGEGSAAAPSAAVGTAASAHHILAIGSEVIDPGLTGLWPGQRAGGNQVSGSDTISDLTSNTSSSGVR